MFNRFWLCNEPLTLNQSLNLVELLLKLQKNRWSFSVKIVRSLRCISSRRSRGSRIDSRVTQNCFCGLSTIIIGRKVCYGLEKSLKVFSFSRSSVTSVIGSSIVLVFKKQFCFCSVALATVTLAYCPYLKASLSDLYAFPVNVEQKVHNACRVVQSWKSVKFSFDVHPQMIVQANKVKIILIGSNSANEKKWCNFME